MIDQNMHDRKNFISTTEIMWFLITDQTKIAAKLIEHGNNVNLQEDGKTPLHISAEYGTELHSILRTPGFFDTKYLLYLDMTWKFQK